MSSINIIINDKPSTTNTKTLNDLLSDLKIDLNGTAIALNQNIVHKSEHKNTLLKNNDEIDIVQAVCGG